MEQVLDDASLLQCDASGEPVHIIPHHNPNQYQTRMTPELNELNLESPFNFLFSMELAAHGKDLQVTTRNWL